MSKKPTKTKSSSFVSVKLKNKINDEFDSWNWKFNNFDDFKNNLINYIDEIYQLRKDGQIIIGGKTHHYKNGLLHNENGPAIYDEYNNYHYFIEGKLHRLDGPAVNRDGYQEWWLNDKKFGTKYSGYTRIDDYSQEKFEKDLMLGFLK